ncbi:MAG: 50S ribosomal protein L10 [Deferrisomatales bacterium]|nr:50S ribosomal protein L10 [Deferrisomatales bacterium]
MNKTEKQATVTELREKFQGAQAAIVTEYRGLTVAKVNELRRSLENEGAVYRVVKNTLARLALEGTEYEVLHGEFSGPVAVTWAYRDPVAAAKVLTRFAKDTPVLTVRSGALGGKLLTAADVEALAKLPSREQLLGQLLSVLVGPMRNLVGVLSGVPRSFVQVLHAIEEKKAA